MSPSPPWGYRPFEFCENLRVTVRRSPGLKLVEILPRPPGWWKNSFGGVSARTALGAPAGSGGVAPHPLTVPVVAPVKEKTVSGFVVDSIKEQE